jgi:hypothetical protein
MTAVIRSGRSLGVVRGLGIAATGSTATMFRHLTLPYARNANDEGDEDEEHGRLK